MIYGREFTYAEFIALDGIKHLDDVKKRYQYFLYGQTIALQRAYQNSSNVSVGGGSVEEEPVIEYKTKLYLGGNF